MQQFTIKTRERKPPGRLSAHIARFWQAWTDGPSRVSPVVLTLCLLLLSACGHAATQTPAAAGNQGGNAASSTAALTYVAIGASDTFGIGTQRPYTENWPTDLNSLINAQSHAQYRLINLGIPGMTLHAALTTELPIALKTHPNLITIWLAVNDLATNVPVNSYSQDLDTLLSSLQAAAPLATIEVGNVPDLTSVPFFASYNQFTLRQQMAAYNQAIDSIVQKHHALLVDLSGQGYNLRAFPEYISSDGLHPSATGYLQLANLFYQALRDR